MKKTILLSFVATSLLLASCKENNKNVVGRPQQYTEREIQAEGAKLNKWVDARYDEYLGTHPQTATFLGDKRGYDKWNNITEAALLAERDDYKEQAAWLKDSVDAKALDVQEQITYKLYTGQVNDAIERYEYRNNPYLVNQMFGMQSDIPAFLINMHHIEDPTEAAAYIARVGAMSKLFDDLISRLKTSASAGVVPPRFVLVKVLDASKNISKGFPITADKAAMNEVFADFSEKVLKCDKIPPPAKAAIMLTMTAAMTKDFAPAYERLITYLEKELLPKSTNDAGVWKFKDGAKYYDFCLRTETTTKMTAEEVHQLGLKEVARIQGEMTDIMKKVKFKGDMQAFFQFMRTDSSFYYPETVVGKAAYITKSNQIIDSMTAALPKIFNTFPKAKLLVKQVEPFREKTAGSAFYDAPSPDGKRKGTYYLNTYDMKSQSKYEMEALAYHEGIPGHHMQLAIAQEMTALPKFRQIGRAHV